MPAGSQERSPLIRGGTTCPVLARFMCITELCMCYMNPHCATTCVKCYVCEVSPLYGALPALPHCCPSLGLLLSTCWYVSPPGLYRNACASSVNALQSPIAVVGYPVGGDSLSITKGIVSRVTLVCGG